MVAVVVLKIDAFISLIVPAETWALCNSNAQLPKHIQAACDGIAQAILQVLSRSM